MDAQFQIVVKKAMTRDDYYRIISNGYNDWYYNYLQRVRADLSKSRFNKIKEIAGFAKQGIRIRRNMIVPKWLKKHVKQQHTNIWTFLAA